MRAPQKELQTVFCLQEIVPHCCFPGEAQVLTEDGTRKKMKEVVLGDKVLTLNSRVQPSFSEVIAFLHYEPNASSEYLKVESEDGHCISISPDHLIFTGQPGGEKKAVFSATLQPGDHIIAVSNTHTQHCKVKQVTSGTQDGIYCILTRTGTLVVDGVLASCYASYKSHKLSHAACAPLRVATALTKKHTGKTPKEEGIHGYAQFLSKVGKAITPGYMS